MTRIIQDMRFREVLSKIPFKILVPFFYIAFYLSILVALALWPLVYLYGLLLCPRVWIEWAKDGKDLLVVHADTEDSRKWCLRILPLVEGRAVFLDYSQRDQWNRWSLAAQLFGIFGPQAIPEILRIHSLPAVIMFKRMRRPKTFVFGRSKSAESALDKLRSELALKR